VIKQPDQHHEGFVKGGPLSETDSSVSYVVCEIKDFVLKCITYIHCFVEFVNNPKCLNSADY